MSFHDLNALKISIGSFAVLNLLEIFSWTSLTSDLKKGFVFNSMDNNEGIEGDPFSLNFKTSLYLESVFWLNGSASFANIRLDKVYSCPQYTLVLSGRIFN